MSFTVTKIRDTVCSISSLFSASELRILQAILILSYSFHINFKMTLTINTLLKKFQIPKIIVSEHCLTRLLAGLHL